MPFADAQANARRRSRSESVQTGSVAAGDQLALPFRSKVSRLPPRPARSCMRLCFDARTNEQNRGSAARTAKAFRPANWSARRAATSVGAVLIRSFGVSFLYEIRRYKSIEKCRGRSVAALGERSLKNKWMHELRPADIA
jgi:hypothetical protein